MINYIKPIAVALSTFTLLPGCATSDLTWDASAEAGFEDDEFYGKLKFTLKPRSHDGGSGGSSSGDGEEKEPLDLNKFDAVQYSVDTLGSTGNIPGTGKLHLLLHNENGFPVASKAFDWYRSGTNLWTENATAVNQWVHSHDQIAEPIYEITTVVEYVVPAESGTNVTEGDAVYNGDVVASASASAYYNSTGCHSISGPPSERDCTHTP